MLLDAFESVVDCELVSVENFTGVGMASLYKEDIVSCVGMRKVQKSSDG